MAPYSAVNPSANATSIASGSHCGGPVLSCSGAASVWPTAAPTTTLFDKASATQQPTSITVSTKPVDDEWISTGQEVSEVDQAFVDDWNARVTAGEATKHPSNLGPAIAAGVCASVGLLGLAGLLYHGTRPTDGSDDCERSDLQSIELGSRPPESAAVGHSDFKEGVDDFHKEGPSKYCPSRTSFETQPEPAPPYSKSLPLN